MAKEFCFGLFLLSMSNNFQFYVFLTFPEWVRHCFLDHYLYWARAAIISIFHASQTQIIFQQFFRWSFATRNQNVIECGRVWTSSCRELSWQHSQQFQVFQHRNFKIHSSIMWSLQEGPRESNEPLGIFPRNRGMFKFFIRSFPSFTHSAIAVAIAERGGVQKLCPFRSSNHGRPIVIYQSFCFADVFHIEIHFTQRPRNKKRSDNNTNSNTAT